MLTKVHKGSPYETLLDFINHKTPSLATLKKLWLSRFKHVGNPRFRICTIDTRTCACKTSNLCLCAFPKDDSAAERRTFLSGMMKILVKIEHSAKQQTMHPRVSPADVVPNFVLRTSLTWLTSVVFRIAYLTGICFAHLRRPGHVQDAERKGERVHSERGDRQTGAGGAGVSPSCSRSGRWKRMRPMKQKQMGMK